MPLRAIVGNETVLAPFLNNEEWKQLEIRIKQEKLEVTLPCCNQNAYLRTSKYGIRHFVHKIRDNCTSEPETWQHLKAKQEIILACRAAGYEAIPEAQGEGWRADVLATKGKAKIAFEVQWSPQDLEETEARQKRYKDAGVRGCWFFRKPPGHVANHELPLFQLEIEEIKSEVLITQLQATYNFEYDEYDDNQIVTRIPLTEFVKALLTQKIRFCEDIKTQPRQKLRLIFIEINCWKCNQPYHIYYARGVILTTRCGQSIIPMDGELWEGQHFFFNPDIVTAARLFTKSDEGAHLKLGSIKSRYSKTVEKNYISFGCYHCDAIFGDFFLRNEILARSSMEEKAAAVLEKDIIFNIALTENHPHWCFPENGIFCCG